MVDTVTGDEFKTILEMVRMIVESAKDKEEALKKNQQPDNFKRH